MSAVAPDVDVELAREVARYYADPLGFVRFAYPWGRAGALEQYDGPDKWQTEFLVWIGEQVRERRFNGRDAVMAIRAAVSSGHGIGKSTMVAWLCDWLMSTRPHAQGTVTANSWDQLNTKTWPAIKKWTALCITSHWWRVTESRLSHVDHPDTWYCALQSSKKDNSEAFAGQHAIGSTSFYLFDEDSGIDDVIHEVAEGGLTDGEPMIFLFGNCTRRSGHFYQSCFGSGRDRWNPRVIDSRDSALTNKAQLQEWIDTYGEDSDFVRVRVLGLPPMAGDLQFIDAQRVYEAQKRHLTEFPDDPLLVGVDVSDGGAAWNVIRFRRGPDARSIPPVRIPGEAVRNDRSMLLAKLADVLTTEYRYPDGSRSRPAMMFIDSAFGAPYVEGLRRMGHQNVMEVRFGATSPDLHQANMRASMWAKCKEWLGHGAISDADQRLETDLTAPGYAINRKDQLVIESKEDMAKRGVASPDDADALVLTFAAPVLPKRSLGMRTRQPSSWAAV